MKIACCAPLLLFASLAVAQEPGQPRFIVHTVDGPLPPAPLLQLADDFTLKVGGDSSRQIPGKDVVAIRQASRARPRFLSQNVVVLNNGDRVPVDAAAPWRLDQDRLYFRAGSPLQSPKELTLSVNYVAVLRFGATDGETLDDQDLLLAKLLGESRASDVVLFADGDRLAGTLKSLDSTRGAVLDVNGKDTPIPRARIKAIAFNTEFKAKPRSKGAFAQLVLSGGGRLGLSQIRLEGGKDMLTGTTLFGPAVEVPLALVRAIDIRQGSAVYLSDLPCVFEQKPFLNASWPLVKDASASGKPLQLREDVFDKGLSMHSQSRAIFKLGAQYRWFEAVVGLDEHHGRQGRVRLKVLVDGKECDLIPAKSAVRTWKDGPLSLRLDVRGANELILAVEFADFGDVQGLVNWGDARLIK
jgi:NPCBM/NEW2 domain